MISLPVTSFGYDMGASYEIISLKLLQIREGRTVAYVL